MKEIAHTIYMPLVTCTYNIHFYTELNLILYLKTKYFVIKVRIFLYFSKKLLKYYFLTEFQNKLSSALCESETRVISRDHQPIFKTATTQKYTVFFYLFCLNSGLEIKVQKVKDIYNF